VIITLLIIILWQLDYKHCSNVQMWVCFRCCCILVVARKYLLWGVVASAAPIPSWTFQHTSDISLSSLLESLWVCECCCFRKNSVESNCSRCYYLATPRSCCYCQTFVFQKQGVLLLTMGLIAHQFSCKTSSSSASWPSWLDWSLFA